VRLLLDTHALIWWRTDSDKLTQTAFAALADPTAEVYVSAVSAWEISTKFRLGKLPLAQALLDGFVSGLVKARFTPLAISVEHGLRAGSLAGEHKDPFDRMLIAQALEEDLTIISNEAAFDGFGVRRLW
jgi:PIN domain nuclease of toxin-antitoxin system